MLLAVMTEGQKGESRMKPKSQVRTVMRITDALREEHKVFNVTLDELDQLVSRRADLDQIVAKASLLAKALSSHSHIEDDILFRPLKSDLGPIDATMTREHQEIEGGLLEIVVSRIADAEIQDPQHAWDAVTGIVELARQHLAKEEKIVYPMVEAILRRRRLRAFGSSRLRNSSASLNMR